VIYCNKLRRTSQKKGHKNIFAVTQNTRLAGEAATLDSHSGGVQIFISPSR
jgi:hypothetical protein